MGLSSTYVGNRIWATNVHENFPAHHFSFPLPAMKESMYIFPY